MRSAKNVSLGDKFPQDDCFWRVDWILSVISKHAEKEPEITVFLTKINDATQSKINPLQPSSIYKTTTTPPNRIAVPIGIGHQSLVSIGAVWKNGINVSRAYSYERFELKLDTSKAVPITFQHTNVIGKRVISPLQYPVGATAFEKIKNSTLIAIPYNNDSCGFMIPASEIVRFYYLISTQMSMALYYNKFDSLVREGETLFLPMNRIVEFTLNWGVSIFDVPIIARYLSSEVMQERVSEIFDWLRINSINKQEQKATTTFFPFDEETNLDFEGMLVKGDDGKQRILCTKLISCSGPIHYDEAIASKMVSESSAEDFQKDQNSLPWYWSFPSYEPIEKIDLVEEPSKKHLTKHFVTLEDRFTTLINKSIVIGKIKYKNNKKKKIRYETTNETRKISTSNGIFGQSNTRKANFIVDLGPNSDDSPIPPRLHSYLDALSLLRKKGFKVETIAVTLPKKYEGKRGYNPVSISEISGEIAIGCFRVGKVHNSWVNVEIHGNLKPRGMMIAKVSYGSRLAYLFELEQKVKGAQDKPENFSLLIQYKSDFSAFSNEELYDFILSCGVNKKWASMTLKDESTLKRLKVNHTENFIDRIHEVIKSVLLESQIV